MKERGKAIKTCPTDLTPCDKHPYSSHVGICPLCLTHKLTNLVCSDCGKSRVSSCCCGKSRVFDVGSVGRLSFFIDNEINIDCNNPVSSKSKFLLRRSSSTCVGVKKKNGFWRLLFGKKTNINGVSRSESFSNAKIFSDDSNPQFGCFSNQLEVCDGGVCNFPIKVSDRFSSTDDDREFIDLNLDSMSEDFVCGGGGGDDNNGVSDIYRNGDSKIGGKFAGLKGKWGLWKRGFLQ